MKKPELESVFSPKKAIVLSSGGIDSTTCLAMAIDRFGADNVVSLSFFYGQKHDRELNCSSAIAEFYEVKHYILNMTTIFEYSNCSLLKRSTEIIEDGSYESQVTKADNGMVNTYVPFRNGLFLSSAASLAMSIFPEEDCLVYIGAHSDDAAGNAYADCRKDFTDCMNEAINIGTYNKVQLYAPLIEMNKAKVVQEGLKLEAPYELTSSCYNGGYYACGKCATCLDRLKAFEANGIKDPIYYKKESEI